jgi:hypothetical protein
MNTLRAHASYNANIEIEEVDVPMFVSQGKGKEHEPPMLRLRLTWAGRLAQLDELGLPSSPPGKMFRNVYGRAQQQRPARQISEIGDWVQPPAEESGHSESKGSPPSYTNEI